jgi:hypothetical protein
MSKFLEQEKKLDFDSTLVDWLDRTFTDEYLNLHVQGMFDLAADGEDDPPRIPTEKLNDLRYFTKLLLLDYHKAAMKKQLAKVKQTIRRVE